MYRRVSTRTLSAIGINRWEQIAIRDGARHPIIIHNRRLGSFIVTYHSSGCYVLVSLANWFGDADLACRIGYPVENWIAA